jgi:hypothetical protein
LPISGGRAGPSSCRCSAAGGCGVRSSGRGGFACVSYSPVLQLSRCSVSRTSQPRHQRIPAAWIRSRHHRPPRHHLRRPRLRPPHRLRRRPRRQRHPPRQPLRLRLLRRPLQPPRRPQPLRRPQARPQPKLRRQFRPRPKSQRSAATRATGTTDIPLTAARRSTTGTRASGGRSIRDTIATIGTTGATTTGLCSRSSAGSEHRTASGPATNVPAERYPTGASNNPREHA